ncbi:MBL fold metallo-hydrolase [Tunturibacter empetritectus]|uniref:Ribonuclease BN (tRNA processing enzyme) n=1 Tax=Tunturiibacter lichenicola TaxID=2051959 RepID=A0A7W8J7X2_9BACT|nr:MBL fold metallo-hydrolase [Edaphobacter lichenicola]MBB5344295.1 ribonuclease BN (tRNA processing enzyme) [Edaphobacter lichenicola]
MRLDRQWVQVRVRGLLLLGLCGLVCGFVSATAQSCGSTGLAVQVLGSGGPESQAKRASTSYLIWQDGRARVILDAGGGSALRFGESGAQMSQPDVFLFSHFHVDHSSDFPALIFSSWFEDRRRALPVFGPPGNDFMPSTTEFVRDMFSDPHGAFRYLSELVEPGTGGSYQLQPHNVVAGAEPALVFRSGAVVVYAVRVIHGQVPALAWRVDIGGKRIVFSGDTNGEGEGLTRLAMNADLLVAHNAVPEGATGVERRLHMPPSVIGMTAGNAHVKKLVLSHRMLRTLGKEEESMTEIRRRFDGPIVFANDLDCFPM